MIFHRHRVQGRNERGLVEGPVLDTEKQHAGATRDKSPAQAAA